MKPLWLVVAVGVTLYAVLRRRRLGTLARALAAVAAVACGLYGTGAFQLPNVEELILGVGEALGPYTYILVGLGAFLETGAFVGLIAPGETLMIVGGVIAGQGEISLVPLVALVWACAVAGDTVSFFLGRRLGRAFMLRHGPKVKITEERLERVEAFFERRGGVTILVGRFIGLVRAIAPFVAGTSRMSYRRFLPYDVLGAGLWAATFCVLGYVFWQSFDRVSEYASTGAFALGTVIVVVVAVAWVVRRLRDAEQRRIARSWLERQAARPALRPVAAALRPVLVRVVVPAARHAGRPARFLADRLRPTDLGLALTTLVAVWVVGGFAFGSLLHEVDSSRYATGDLDALSVVADLRVEAVADLARVVSGLGAFGVAAAVLGLAAVVLVVRGHAVEAGALVVAMVLTRVAVDVAAEALARPRPDAADALAGSRPDGIDARPRPGGAAGALPASPARRRMRASPPATRRTLSLTSGWRSRWPAAWRCWPAAPWSSWWPS